MFTEIAQDESATGQAVAISAVAAMISNLTDSGAIVGRIIGGAVAGVIGLFIWTGIVFVVGKLFGGTADYIRLLRPVGYAAAPFAIGIIPILSLLGAAYSLVIQIRLVREVNRVGDGAAAATVLLPFAAIVVLVVIAIVALGIALAGLVGDI